MQFPVTYFIDVVSHVEIDWLCAVWLVILLPVEHEYLMGAAWCNWYFEETSLLSPDAFSCWSGSDYRVDTQFGVRLRDWVCPHSVRHMGTITVCGVSALLCSSLRLSVGLSLCSCCLSLGVDDDGASDSEVLGAPLISVSAFCCMWHWSGLAQLCPGLGLVHCSLVWPLFHCFVV